MGCNTSQELKTKDGSSTGVNGTTAAVGEHNGENVTSEQNCNNEDAQQHQNGGDMGQEGMKSLATTKTPTTESSKTQHSINSNGDATNIKHLNSSSLPPMAKENGSIPQNSCNKAEISELNDMDDMGEDEAKAATKIQAVFRGHKVRNTMKKSETKTSNNTPAVAAASSEAEPTKEELEAEFDPNDKELCSAALKIQSTFRGHLSRKLVAKEVPEDVDIQEITKKVAEELDIDLSDPELNKAATKIQASFRGHKTRKDTQPIE
ncbi:IQ calmodulin-binding domain containing protein igloo [Haematobia irritans]|uniref:IQ calmodulin-binding domain containing protein igloo n=1 Tax=Haematobia irritans TaxID=7368 RepID=UPI003F506BCC